MSDNVGLDKKVTSFVFGLATAFGYTHARKFVARRYGEDSQILRFLAHELGHAEDPEEETITYDSSIATANALSPGAALAGGLLSEGKAQYNNITAVRAMPAKCGTLRRSCAWGCMTARRATRRGRARTDGGPGGSSGGRIAGLAVPKGAARRKTRSCLWRATSSRNVGG